MTPGDAPARPAADDALSAAASGPVGRGGPDLYRDPAQEKEVWQGRPAWAAYYGEWALWLLAVIVGLVLTYRGPNAPDSVLPKVVWTIVLGSAVALWVRQALVIYGQHFRLTTQRLVVRRGILSRTTDQLELVRVDDVRFRQGVIDRVVRTGNIEVLSSDATDAKLVLRGIADPEKTTEHIRRNVRSARGKGSLFIENV